MTRNRISFSLDWRLEPIRQGRGCRACRRGSSQQEDQSDERGDGQDRSGRCIGRTLEAWRGSLDSGRLSKIVTIRFCDRRTPGSSCYGPGGVSLGRAGRSRPQTRKYSRNKLHLRGPRRAAAPSACLANVAPLNDWCQLRPNGVGPLQGSVAPGIRFRRPHAAHLRCGHGRKGTADAVRAL